MVGVLLHAFDQKLNVDLFGAFIFLHAFGFALPCNAPTTVEDQEGEDLAEPDVADVEE